VEDLAHVHDRLVGHESHLMVPRTEAILTGLGFEPADHHRPLTSFSGGWRMRVALAQLLLSDPDVLLLDEPTNHLDIDSIDWLENHLRTWNGTVIIVSHDRYFLDRMVTGIVELSGGHLTEYAGNYAFYLEERVSRRELHRASYENQQRMIAETERFIERFRYKATKARQVQSRVKQLEHLERIPPPIAEEASIMFRFPDPPRSGRVVLELSQFSKAYDTEGGSIEVFTDAPPVKIERGDHIALIGQNGAGKSTLARILLGTEPFEGDRKEGFKVEMSFFAQHQAESLPETWTIFELLREHARDKSDTWIRTLLGAFLFHGDDVFKPISVLSGGERSRVALAKTLISPSNFLILDEPTNHLDIRSRNVLVEALRQFSGTFVLVSHDRHFLDRVSDKIWRAEEGTIREYHGNYSDYLWQISEGTAGKLMIAGDKSNHRAADSKRTPGPEPQAEPKAKQGGGAKTKVQKREEAELRQKRYDRRKKHGQAEYGNLNTYQLKKLYEKMETTILAKENRKSELETTLMNPELFQDASTGKRTLVEFESVQEELAELYRSWESITEEISSR
jgi:ATP-binding cassette, subfamily F, member 3